MNGRIFVNNVSLGLYATIVQSPEYRDAKRETTLATLPTAQPAPYEGCLSWAAPRFEVTSAEPIAVGLDGKSLQLDPPLVFASRPGVLRLRLPLRAIGDSSAARATGARGLLGLWRVVLGRPVRIGV